MAEIAVRMDVTPSQVGLAWLLQHAADTLLIPGTTSVQHLEDNMAVTSAHLDDGAMAELAARAPALPAYANDGMASRSTAGRSR